MDVLSDLPEPRKRILRLLRSLCGSWGELPSSYALSGEVKLLDDRPFAPASPFVEVFRGMFRDEMVAVKALAVYMSDDPNRVKEVDDTSRCLPQFASD